MQQQLYLTWHLSPQKKINPSLGKKCDHHSRALVAIVAVGLIAASIASTGGASLAILGVAGIFLASKTSLAIGIVGIAAAAFAALGISGCSRRPIEEPIVKPESKLDRTAGLRAGAAAGVRAGTSDVEGARAKLAERRRIIGDDEMRVLEDRLKASGKDLDTLNRILAPYGLEASLRGPKPKKVGFKDEPEVRYLEKTKAERLASERELNPLGFAIEEDTLRFELSRRLENKVVDLAIARPEYLRAMRNCLPDNQLEFTLPSGHTVVLDDKKARLLAKMADDRMTAGEAFDEDRFKASIRPEGSKLKRVNPSRVGADSQLVILPKSSLQPLERGPGGSVRTSIYKPAIPFATMQKILAQVERD